MHSPAARKIVMVSPLKWFNVNDVPQSASSSPIYFSINKSASLRVKILCFFCLKTATKSPYAISGSQFPSEYKVYCCSSPVPGSTCTLSITFSEIYRSPRHCLQIFEGSVTVFPLPLQSGQCAYCCIIILP